MVVWYLDFDGVFNIELSLNKVNKARKLDSNLFGFWLKRTAFYAGVVYSVPFSAELVAKMHSLSVKTGTTWLWLTTWVGYTSDVDNALNKLPAHDAVPWTPTRNVKDDVERSRLNGLEKYRVLKEHHDGVTPFVWVDDEATVNYNPDDFTCPHLVIATNADYGITRSDYEKIKAFTELHSDVALDAVV